MYLYAGVAAAEAEAVDNGERARGHSLRLLEYLLFLHKKKQII